jgi:hypothetical protein
VAEEFESALDDVDAGRRSFLKKVVVGTAFAAPVVSSFTMTGIKAVYASTPSVSPARAATGTTAAGNQTTSTTQPNQTTSTTQPNQTTSTTQPNQTTSTTSANQTVTTTSPNQTGG